MATTINQTTVDSLVHNAVATLSRASGQVDAEVIREIQQTFGIPTHVALRVVLDIPMDKSITLELIPAHMTSIRQVAAPLIEVSPPGLQLCADDAL